MRFSSGITAESPFANAQKLIFFIARRGGAFEIRTLGISGRQIGIIFWRESTRPWHRPHVRACPAFRGWPASSRAQTHPAKAPQNRPEQALYLFYRERQKYTQFAASSE